MKRLEIFKAGRRTPGNTGEALDFTEDHLRATVEAYDPKIHEAPIVVGHPRDNAPAYGWIQGLDFAEESLSATTDQVMPEFAEMVKDGRFKKRSASFYRPDSPNNPVPGVYYLRHVGFLGAQPPAVKGLQDPEFAETRIGEAVDFSDTDEDVVEFTDSPTVATLFRRMREFFLSQFGQESADATIPGWLVEDLEAEARRETESPDIAPSFNEGDPQNPTGDPAMTLTPEQIADLQAKAKRTDELETEVASFKEREDSISAREAKLARAEIEKSVDALIDEGRVLPAERENTCNFLESLSDSAELDFSEGEGDDAKTVKKSQRAAYLDQLAIRPPIVDFEERSADTTTGDDKDMSSYDVAQEAADFRESEREAGRHITAAQAVNAVKAGKHKK